MALDRNQVLLRQIRAGEFKEQEIYELFYSKEKELQKLYEDSDLPYASDVEPDVKELLLKCLGVLYHMR